MVGHPALHRPAGRGGVNDRARPSPTARTVSPVEAATHRDTVGGGAPRSQASAAGSRITNTASRPVHTPAGRGYRPPVLTVVTWNLRGRSRPDVPAAARHLRAVGADVVAVQEVQRRQARALARELRAESLDWGFKHWPVVKPAEGMAVIGVTTPVDVHTVALSYRWRPFTSHRRIYQIARVDGMAGDGGAGGRFTLANLHLSTGEGPLRQVEVRKVLGAVKAAGRPALVVGDLNERPSGPAIAELEAYGLRDTWAVTHPDTPERDGATNWSGWQPCTDKPPTKRIDYVMAAPQFAAGEVTVPRPGEPGFEAFACLSDHLPLAAGVELAAPTG